MPADDSLTERERRLDEVVTDYLRAPGANPALARQVLLVRHPDLAAELAEFFALQDHLYKLATPLRCVARAAEQVTRLVGETTSTDAGPESAEARREFGGYELLGRVGAGGMGVVYRARQKGLNRLVALKVIRMRELASAGEARRFRNEAETAAALEHPHVVPVYEVNEHEDQLYYSMRLMEGGSLAEQMGRFQNEPRGAARLVAIVARAVQYAHQRGILHRDLKPANILLDGEGQPHVSDFGLAKRVEADSSRTQSGVLVGTPSYMAPEQANGRKGAITTATDVYGLGAVLYAMLTGRPPFQGESVLETLELVKNCDPEPPRRINAKVNRDLETICVKCLAKEADLRYDSAEAVAEELEGWMAGKPIRARAVGRLERLWRWCKRNPLIAGLMSTLIAVMSLTIITFGASTVMVLRAYQSEAAQRHQAERHFRQAREAVDQMLIRVGDDRLKDIPQMEEVRRELLEEALKFYQDFLHENPTQSGVRQELGKAYLRVGEIQNKLGQNENAEEAYRQALIVFESLTADFPGDPDHRRDLARSYFGLGRSSGDGFSGRFPNVERALAIQEQLVADFPTEPNYRQELAESYWFVGYSLRASNSQLPYAEKALRRAIEVQEKLVTETPAVMKYRESLGHSLGNLGDVLLFTARTKEAELVYQESFSLRKRLVEDFPQKLPFRADLGDAHMNLGMVLAKQGRMEKAEQQFRSALTLWREEAANFPNTLRYQSRTPYLQMQLAEVLDQLQQPQEAEEAYRIAFRDTQELCKRYPKYLGLTEDLAIVNNGLGHLSERAGRLEQAEQAYRQDVLIMDELVSTDRGKKSWRARLAAGQGDLARVLWFQGRREEAQHLFGQAVQCWSELTESEPDDFRHSLRLGSLLVTFPDPTLRDPNRAVGLAKSAAQRAPQDGECWKTLGMAQYRSGDWRASAASLCKPLPVNRNFEPRCWFFLAMVQARLSETGQAQKWYDKAARWIEKNQPASHELRHLRAEAAAVLKLINEPIPGGTKSSIRNN
jgi:tetratricopeptide (TPR) repeat protein